MAVGQGTLVRNGPEAARRHAAYPRDGRRAGRHRKASALAVAGRGPSRLVIAVGAVLFQVSLGGFYSWSVLAQALQEEGGGFGISRAQAVLPFSVANGVVFLGCFLGGRLQDRKGPRVVAYIGGTLYAAGTILSSFATDVSLFWLMLLAYGVVGGIGLGMAYIVPVAMLQKWYPDKRGLITGVAVGGFGFGAVLASPLARWLVAAYQPVPTRAFLPLGFFYLLLTVLGASVFRNPPPRPPAPGPRRNDFTCAQALHTRQWYMLTAMLTLSTIAGIGFVAVTAGAAAALTGITAGAAALLTGLMGLSNGAGRVILGMASEKIGRMRIFTMILTLEGLCLLAVPYANSLILFIPLAAIIFACFGGAFAVMPATAGDFFGLTHAGAIYGLMNIAWSIGGVVGPLLVSTLAESAGYRTAFFVLALIPLSATVLPVLTRPPGRRSLRR